jgi:hypothetical protein
MEGVLAWAGDGDPELEDDGLLPVLVATGILAWAAGRLDRAWVVLTAGWC